jgi:hypothetical protein
VINVVNCWLNTGYVGADAIYTMSRLMCSFAGSTATTGFTDESYARQGAGTAVGNAARANSNMPAFCNASLALDGTGDQLTFPAATFQPAANDFSINLFAKFHATPTNTTQAITSQWRNDGNNSWQITHNNSTNTLTFNGSSSGGAADVTVSGSWTPGSTDIQFIRVEREGPMLRLWAGPENGTASLIGETSIGGGYSFYASTTQLRLGARLNSGGSTEAEFRGNISEACFYIGGVFCHSSASFSVPTTRFPRKLAGDPATPVPTYSDVVLHVRGGGVDGNTSFTDLSTDARTLTPSGNVQNDTGVDIFGTSILFDGTGDYISVPNHADFSIANAVDFTFEVWARHTSTKVNTMLCKRDSGDANEFEFHLNASNQINFNAFNSGSNVLATQGPATLGTGTTRHYAITRWGSSYLLFVDGVMVAAGAASGTPDSNSQTFQIGRSSFNTGRDFAGSMNHIRITRAALYTYDFTPPTPPLPTS